MKRSPLQVGNLFLQILLMTVISLLVTILLAFFLRRIDHHIKFVPIILVLILIYFVSKYFHLPGLIFILLFGLLLGNAEKVNKIKGLGTSTPAVYKMKYISSEKLQQKGPFSFVPCSFGSLDSRSKRRMC